MRPTAILTADWHIRSTTPSCRKDDFIEAQWKKIEFIFNLASRYKCPILIAGDLGDKPEWKNEDLSKFIGMFNHHEQGIYCVPGQHDIPSHNKNLFYKGGLETLRKSGSLVIARSVTQSRDSQDFSLTGCWYSQQILKPSRSAERNVLLLHKMVVNSEDLYPGQNADSGIKILKENPDYDLIICGDNHQSFCSHYYGRVLVNCGNIMRDDIGQKDFKPCVWLWYVENNSVEQVYLPIQKDVFKEENESKEIDRNLNSYVEKLQKEYTQGMSFQKNLESFLRQHKVEKNVCDKIWKSLGENQ